MKNIFVTAIGTDSGKTLVAAILCEATGFGYWKPIQAGLPRDTDTVSSLVSTKEFKTYPEQYLLNTPASPHAAAKIDGVDIRLKDLKLPTEKALVIEGAGGCLVPINDSEFVIDLVSASSSEIILVSNLYLGSINHTLLTLHYIRSKQLPLKGIIFNGPSNEESERIILRHANSQCMLRIHQEANVSREVVRKYAEEFRKNLI